MLALTSIIAGLTLGSNSCHTGNEKICCVEKGAINLDFSTLPPGPLVMFTVGSVDGIRIYQIVKREGTSLRLIGCEEIQPGSGNRENAAVILLFHRLPCNVSMITVEVHGHGYEAHIAAAQRDSSTQTALCPGDKRVLTLHASEDNPFIYAILSGQDAEWLRFKLE